MKIFVRICVICGVKIKGKSCLTALKIDCKIFKKHLIKCYDFYKKTGDKNDYSHRKCS